MLESKKQEQGFTLVEVLVAILIATLFVAVTMNMMVAAAILKAKARYYSEGINWIQKNLENVKYAAIDTTLYTTTRCTAASYSTGYAKGLSDKIDATYPLSTSSATSSDLTQIAGGKFKLTRTYDTMSPAPYNVLRITYNVQEWTGSTLNSNPVATVYTEVMPDAALNCP